MNNEIERRLHRVMIKLDKLDKLDIKCPFSTECIRSERCNRCNLYFHKCSIYSDFDSK